MNMRKGRVGVVWRRYGHSRDSEKVQAIPGGSRGRFCDAEDDAGVVCEDVYLFNLFLSFF